MSRGRISDPNMLDPEFREKVELVLHAMQLAGIPLLLYESIRSPLRQEELYDRGRVDTAADYGRTVTDARAYQSAHQFGAGADLVFFTKGRWTWEEPEDGMWEAMHKSAKVWGLMTLKDRRGRVKEWPHVQVAGFDWRQHARGPADTAGWLMWLGDRVA